jgi:hypothetical protein
MWVCRFSRCGSIPPLLHVTISEWRVLIARPDQSMNTHPPAQPTRHYCVRHYVGAQFLRCEPFPRCFNRTASFSRTAENTTVHVIVLDSVLHCGTTIAVINAKPIERQHVSTTHCSNYHTPNAMFDAAHTVPARKGRCRNRAAVSELLKPCDARLLRCYPISTRINHVANDDEECSRPVELAQIQERLFI